MKTARLLPTLLVVSCAAAPAVAQTVDRPEWIRGDTWTVSRVDGPTGGNPAHVQFLVTWTVTGMSKERYRVVRTVTEQFGDRTEVTQNGEWSRDINGFFRQNTDLPWTEIKFLQWPLDVGRTWSFEVPTVVPERPFVWQMSVDGKETVTVPAGTFETWVVTGYGIHKGGVGTHERRVTLWYSPSAKRAVRFHEAGRYAQGASAITDQVTEELLSFKVVTPPSYTAATAGRYDGDWNAAFACSGTGPLPPRTFERRIAVRAGNFVVENGVAGSPGFYRMSGRPDDAGQLTLAGEGIAGSEPYRGQKVVVRFEGRRVDDRFMLTGRYGSRSCEVAIARIGN